MDIFIIFIQWFDWYFTDIYLLIIAEIDNKAGGRGLSRMRRFVERIGTRRPGTTCSSAPLSITASDCY